MTTRERLELLCQAYPRLFPRADLLRLLRDQLGHAEALDRWVKRDGYLVRARPPKMIYHICAGNLAVSAWTSLAHGLLLGAHNVVKLPSDRDDSHTRREIHDFIHGLPAPLRKMVETHRMLDTKTLSRAEVVIAFGSDETMQSLHTQLRWNQKFIAHGHAVSLLWIEAPNRLTPQQARACAKDVLTYDQLGCLSPQAIYLRPGSEVPSLAHKLASALETEWQVTKPKPPRALGLAARIAEARDLAYALGQRVWLPPGRHLGWTLIHDPDPTFQPSPLHGVISLREVAKSQLSAALASVAGRISTVGIVSASHKKGLSSRLEEAFLSLGVSRFCPAGHMQFPHLTWHHDGRHTLSDLVTWIDFETSA